MKARLKTLSAYILASILLMFAVWVSADPTDVVSSGKRGITSLIFGTNIITRTGNIQPGTNITFTDSGGTNYINAPSGFSLIVDTNAAYTSSANIQAGTSIAIRTVGGTNYIDATGSAAGEANTASTSGGGLPLTLAKSGVDLPFRGLTFTAGLSITTNATDAIFALDWAAINATNDTRYATLAMANNSSNRLDVIEGWPTSSWNAAYANVSSTVTNVQAGSGVTVDISNPRSPIISASVGAGLQQIFNSTNFASFTGGDQYKWVEFGHFTTTITNGVATITSKCMAVTPGALVWFAFADANTNFLYTSGQNFTSFNGGNILTPFVMSAPVQVTGGAKTFRIMIASNGSSSVYTNSTPTALATMSYITNNLGWTVHEIGNAP